MRIELTLGKTLKRMLKRDISRAWQKWYALNAMLAARAMNTAIIAANKWADEEISNVRRARIRRAFKARVASEARQLLFGGWMQWLRVSGSVEAWRRNQDRAFQLADKALRRMDWSALGRAFRQWFHSTLHESRSRRAEEAIAAVTHQLARDGVDLEEADGPHGRHHRRAAHRHGNRPARHQRGTPVVAPIHVADWYTTLCALAGVDHTDTRAAQWGLPPVDGIDQWDAIASPASPLRWPVSQPAPARRVLSSSLVEGPLQIRLRPPVRVRVHAGV